MSAQHATQTLPVVTFPDFPAVHTLGELRVAVIDFDHLAGWFGVIDPTAEQLVRHSMAVLVLIGAFCFQERRPKAARWSRTPAAHVIRTPLPPVFA